MKITTTLLAAGMVAAFCCSIGKVQASINYTNAFSGGVLIYSNAFNGSGSVNITNTQANYEAAVFGGSINTNWIDALGASDTNAYYASGVVGTAQGDSVLLPFVPTSNCVYTLSAKMTFSAAPSSWIGAGFANYHSIEGGTDDRMTSGGIDWGLLTASSANVQAYNSGSSVQFSSSNSILTGAAIGIPHTLSMVLDTTFYENSSNMWIASCYVDGHIVPGTAYNGYYVYASKPSILGIGLTQNALSSGSQNDFVWNSFTLTANQLVIVGEPTSQSINQGSAYTNTVVVGGAPPFHYQWYSANNAPISGATNASLIINPVEDGDAGTNYYVVVTNLAVGAVTSAPVSLTVFTSPTFTSADPITYTNLMTLFGGMNVDGTDYPGSTPTFSVAAVGAEPIGYFWLTNGVAVGGATNTSFTFTNCQLTSPTSFSCIASNFLGTATNTWEAQYIPTPIAPYPQAVIADGPVAYWRLDDTNVDGADNGEGDAGYICNDFMSGNNGIYTNVFLGQPGYYVITDGVSVTNDPTQTAADFTDYFSDTGNIAYGLGTNVDFSSSSNAEFTVSVWANGGQANDAAEPQNSALVCKGYNGGEEFSLDDGANNACARFMVRNGAATVSGASSAFQLGGNNTWNHLVGVCDEAHGVVNFYINGQLAAQASISSGSGVLANPTNPITIGGNSTSATENIGGYQYLGALDDVAIFPYAMSAAQVAGLYESAGGVVPPYLLPPLPQTNFVFNANTTLTIPALAFGAPPIGYYWTNVTSGGVLGAGTTNALADLNATLTIPDAGGLSGDTLELVVTNASGSTNEFLTLYSPPLPVTLSYTNAILYSNDFDGGTWSIAGQALTGANTLVGGTNTTWIDALGTNDNGSMEANGLDESLEPDSWILPFTPRSGYVYTLTASVTFTGNPGNWIGLGFAQRVVTNAAVGYGRFSDDGSTPPDEGPNGYDWMILTESSGNVQFFAGAGGNGPVTNESGFFTAGAGTHTAQVVLDTTGAQWVQYAFVDGVPAGTNTYTSNPPIGAVGITQNTLSTLAEVQWNYIALSQVAPGGVPPYLLAPLPPAQVTNTTVTIPATAFGSGPLGYYWTLNNTVLASGVTNDTAPISANITVPSSLGGGQLELTVTNAYGTNVTDITLVGLVNPNPTNIVATVTNNDLYLTWPTDHTGWQLQAQTNSLGLGISTNWVDYNPSTGTNQVVIPINPTNGTVFYRMVYTNTAP